VQSLNPLVTVETIPTFEALETDDLDTIVMGVDMVCFTDWRRDSLVRSLPVLILSLYSRFPVFLSGIQIHVNKVCRRLGKPFYAGGSYGLLGYIFCDLLDHDYIAP
jgi:ubiquitin-like 1-activating enzyme E1 A